MNKTERELFDHVLEYGELLCSSGIDDCYRHAIALCQLEHWPLDDICEERENKTLYLNPDFVEWVRVTQKKE